MTSPGWLCFIPLDPTGIDSANEIIAEKMLEHMRVNKGSIIATIQEVRNTLSSLSLKYKLLDCFFRESKNPMVMPNSDDEKTIEYYGAVTPQIRQAGNRLSGFPETNYYASLLA